METVTISKDIELSPSSLHQGYFNDIYNNLCDKYRDTCTKDNGYIIDILDDLKLNSNRISNNTANIIFNVSFTAKILKPEIGNEIKCSVDMLSWHGIFAGINKLKVLIPENALTNYYFDQQNSKYVNKKSKSEIKNGDEITIELTDIRYTKNNYNCIGKLK